MPKEEPKHHFSIGNILTIVTMVLGMAGGYATLAGENAQQKERVDNLKQEAKEIKRDVKETKDNVQLILRKLDSMEAERRAEAKAAERRSRQ